MSAFSCGFIPASTRGLHSHESGKPVFGSFPLDSCLGRNEWGQCAGMVHPRTHSHPLHGLISCLHPRTHSHESGKPVFGSFPLDSCLGRNELEHLRRLSLWMNSGSLTSAELGWINMLRLTTFSPLLLLQPLLLLFF